MGFFPNIFKGSPAHIITNILVPTLPLFTESFKAVAPLGRSAISALQGVRGLLNPPQSRTELVNAPDPHQYGQTGVQYGPVGAYGTPGDYFGGQFNPYAGGAPSWDSSTSLTPYSTLPAWGAGDLYSGTSGAASWEDLLTSSLQGRR